MTNSTPARLPAEIEAIATRIFLLLDSDARQNESMPALVRALIEDGPDCDQLPNATGEFGRSPSNPIPVNGPLGEVVYLSRLTTETGAPVMFHRVGADADGPLVVDVYEVQAIDGSVRERLFLSMYHPRKTKRPPQGYRLADTIDGRNPIWGVSHTVPNFPAKLDAYVRHWQVEQLGLPLPVPKLRTALNGSPMAPSVLSPDELAGLAPRRERSIDRLLRLARPPRS